MWSNNSKLSVWSFIEIQLHWIKMRISCSVQNPRQENIGCRIFSSFFCIISWRSLGLMIEKSCRKLKMKREDREWMRVCSLNWIFSLLWWSGPSLLPLLYGSLRCISLWSECLQAKLEVCGELLCCCCFTAQWRMSSIILWIKAVPSHFVCVMNTQAKIYLFLKNFNALSWIR